MLPSMRNWRPSAAIFLACRCASQRVSAAGSTSWCMTTRRSCSTRGGTPPTRRFPADRAKLWPVSDLRKSLLSLNASTLPDQLTLDQAELDPGELEAQLAEEQALLDQLASFGQVVTIGYASNPERGIFELGWGDVELARRGDRPGGLALLGGAAAARRSGR